MLIGFVPLIGLMTRHLYFAYKEKILLIKKKSKDSSAEQNTKKQR